MSIWGHNVVQRIRHWLYTVNRTSIDTEGHRPIRLPLRRQLLAYQEIIDKEVEEMRRHGIIEPASSPLASNVVMVRKKDGSLRFCVAYRAVSNVTYQDTYPLPRTDSCLDALHGAKWCTTLDLRSGYYNIQVSLQDRDKTSFVTRRGCYCHAVWFDVCAQSISAVDGHGACWAIV